MRPHPRLWARRFLQIPEPVPPPVDADGQPVGDLTLTEAIQAGIATVGRHTYGKPVINVFPGPRPSLTVGAFTSIGAGAKFLCGGAHPTDWVSTFPFRARWGLDGAFHDGQPVAPTGITVGNDVWIAESTVILDGVTIGDGAVIAAGAVVSRDVRPYALVGGVPAREIRRRFDDKTVQRLLEQKWWDWSDDEIARHLDVLCAPITARSPGSCPTRCPT